MRKFFVVLLCLLGVILAQHLDPPILNANIISDYSPRNRDTGNYDFHHGIDYYVTMWREVPAVEGGVIITIFYKNPGAGYSVRIQGDSAFWTYMHLFEDVFINTFYDDSINLLSLNFVLDLFFCDYYSELCFL